MDPDAKVPVKLVLPAWMLIEIALRIARQTGTEENPINAWIVSVLTEKIAEEQRYGRS